MPANKDRLKYHDIKVVFQALNISLITKPKYIKNY
jgi:hypothetical protein